MLKITDIAFTVYPVTDIGKARDFYENRLGLEVCEVVNYADEGGAAGKYWIEFAINGSIFAISNDSELPKQGGVAFEVEDYEAAVAQLKKDGVPFLTDRIDTPVCRFTIIADPDDNEIIIHQLKANDSA